MANLGSWADVADSECGSVQTYDSFDSMQLATLAVQHNPEVLTTATLLAYDTAGLIAPIMMTFPIDAPIGVLQSYLQGMVPGVNVVICEWIGPNVDITDSLQDLLWECQYASGAYFVPITYYRDIGGQAFGTYDVYDSLRTGSGRRISLVIEHREASIRFYDTISASTGVELEYLYTVARCRLSPSQKQMLALHHNQVPLATRGVLRDIVETHSPPW